MDLYTKLLALNITIVVLYVISIVVWVVFLLVPTLPGSVALLSITDASFLGNNTQINFPPWIFGIWYFIFLWQLLWIVFSFRLIFTFRRLGPPVLLTPTFLGLFVLGLLLQIGVTVSGRFVIELTFALLLLQTVTLNACLFLAQTQLYKSRELLSKQNRRFDDTLTRALVHNGIGLYSIWVTVLTFLNVTILIFVKTGETNLQLVTSIVFGFVALYIIIADVLDFYFDRFSRYTFTTFIPAIWISFGSVFVNTGANLVIAAVYLGLTLVALISKIVFVVIQCRDHPLYPPEV